MRIDCITEHFTSKQVAGECTCKCADYSYMKFTRRQRMNHCRLVYVVSLELVWLIAMLALCRVILGEYFFQKRLHDSPVAVQLITKVSLTAGSRPTIKNTNATRPQLSKSAIIEQSHFVPDPTTSQIKYC